MEGGEKMTSGVYERKPKNDEENNILHTAIEFLEKKKEQGNIDVNIINGWQGKIKTLGESIAFGLNEAFEKKNKPIRKVWYWAIKGMEKDVEKIVESHDKWMEQMKVEFPEAKITLSLCQDVMVRNKRGQFEVVKDKE